MEKEICERVTQSKLQFLQIGKSENITFIDNYECKVTLLRSTDKNNGI